MKLIYRGRLPGLNEIVNSARYSKYSGARQKKRVQELLELTWCRARGKTFDDRVIIHINFYEKDHKRDEDNVMAGMKFILDALQKLDVIKQDSQRYVHVLPEVFVDAKNPRVEVIIEPEEKEE